MLQDEHVPLFAGGEEAGGAVGPVVLDGVVVAGDGAVVEGEALGAGHGLHERGEVVGGGEAVAEEEDAAGRRGWLGCTEGRRGEGEAECGEDTVASGVQR